MGGPGSGRHKGPTLLERGVCPRGHPITHPAEVYIEPVGTQRCRACLRRKRLRAALGLPG